MPAGGEIPSRGTARIGTNEFPELSSWRETQAAYDALSRAANDGRAFDADVDGGGNAPPPIAPPSWQPSGASPLFDKFQIQRRSELMPPDGETPSRGTAQVGANEFPELSFWRETQAAYDALPRAANDGRAFDADVNGFGNAPPPIAPPSWQPSGSSPLFDQFQIQRRSNLMPPDGETPSRGTARIGTNEFPELSFWRETQAAYDALSRAANDGRAFDADVDGGGNAPPAIAPPSWQPSGASSLFDPPPLSLLLSRYYGVSG
jgi:hypothetical protein